MPTIVTSWAGSVPSTRNQLMAKVARLYGYSTSDTDFMAVVLDALDEAVNDLNTTLFEFNKVVESGIVLTASTAYVTLSAAFYRDSLAYLVNTATGGRTDPLIYQPWVQFQRWYGDNDFCDHSQQYSVFNFDNEHKLYLHPIPDASTASTYTLTVEYYRRIPLISSVGLNNSIDVPREIETALIYGAQKRIAIHLHGPGDKDVDALEALESRALDRLRRVDRVHPDERKCWMLSDFVRSPRRTNTDFWIRY